MTDFLENNTCKVKQIITNPDFLKDVICFFKLTKTEEQIENIIRSVTIDNPLSDDDISAGSLSLDNKLRTFIDRIEFIEHLKILSDNAVGNKYVIDNKEVRGVDWDISSLRLYLALTCIDIFCSKRTHKDYFDFVFNGISSDLNNEFNKNLKVVYNENKLNHIKEFSLFVYNIRNSYTHAGIRFHSSNTKKYTLSQDFVVGSAKNKSLKKLEIEKGFCLIDFIIKVAIENVKNIFGF